jgi:hypothetical protein
MVVRGLRDTSYKTEHCTRYFLSLCRNNIKEDRLSAVPTYPARSHPWSSSRSIVIGGSAAAGLLQAPRPIATLRQLRILPPNLCSNSPPRPLSARALPLARITDWQDQVRLAALRDFQPAYVGSGSNCDMTASPRHFRSSPNSRHSSARPPCRRSANCGLMHCSK